ncbi:MAG: hypothetical protein ACTHNQ_07525 [Microbacterium sp.]|uniref:hypothetical protein n=1 Tax=Microbacterium sp. TaxID=51671 RepID=UPI003F7FA14E
MDEETDAKLKAAFIAAIDFKAVGSAIAEFGPAAAFEDDPWWRFCGSDLRVYKWPKFQLDIDVLDRVSIAQVRERAVQGGIG